MSSRSTHPWSVTYPFASFRRLAFLVVVAMVVAPREVRAEGAVAVDRSAALAFLAEHPDRALRIGDDLFNIETMQPVGASALKGLQDFQPIAGAPDRIYVGGGLNRALGCAPLGSIHSLKDQSWTNGYSIVDPNGGLHPKTDHAYLNSDHRRIVLIENGDVWRGEIDWPSAAIVNKKKVTSVGLLTDKQVLCWFGNSLYINGGFDPAKPIVRVDLLSGNVEEFDLHGILEGVSSGLQPTCINPAGDRIVKPDKEVMYALDLRSGKITSSPNTYTSRSGGGHRQVPIVSNEMNTGWVDDNNFVSVGHEIIARFDVAQGKTYPIAQQPKDKVTMYALKAFLPGRRYADVASGTPGYGDAPARMIVDLATGESTPLEVPAERWIDDKRCLYELKQGGITQVGLWVYNRETKQKTRLPAGASWGEVLVVPDRELMIFGNTNAASKTMFVTNLEGGDARTIEATGRPSLIGKPIDLGFTQSKVDLWDPARFAASPSVAPLPEPKGSVAAAPSGQMKLQESLKGKSDEYQQWAGDYYNNFNSISLMANFYDPVRMALKAADAREEWTKAGAPAKYGTKSTPHHPESRFLYQKWWDDHGVSMNDFIAPDEIQKYASERMRATFPNPTGRPDNFKSDQDFDALCERVGKTFREKYVAKPDFNIGYINQLFEDTMLAANSDPSGKASSNASSASPAPATQTASKQQQKKKQDSTASEVQRKTNEAERKANDVANKFKSIFK